MEAWPAFPVRLSLGELWSHLQRSLKGKKVEENESYLLEDFLDPICSVNYLMEAILVLTLKFSVPGVEEGMGNVS